MFAVVLTGEALVNFGYTLPPTEMDPPPRWSHSRVLLRESVEVSPAGRGLWAEEHHLHCAGEGDPL